jgi:glycosyltransferase involved in cell wall biosynthesis
MNIGIDGACWANRRGYGRFLRELLEAVAIVDRVNRYTVFFDAAVPPDFQLGDRFRPVVVPTSATVAEAASASGRRSLGDLWRMSRAVAREPLDLFFFPSVYSYFPLTARVPMVLGVHDTIADRNPRFAFSSKRHELFWRAKVRLALAQATTVLTVSDYSKRSIEAHLHVPPAKIRVLTEAASARFRKTEPPPGAGAYVLYAGGISPNKNLAALVRAWARLPRRGFKLVLAGDYQSDGFKSCYAELRALIEEHGLGADVLFPGFVTDEELCALYSGATVFVMPSFDEGFGLPALEAMACGAPVIAAEGHALEEVVGSAGLLVDPNDDAALAQAIGSVIEDTELRIELSRRSLERAAEFSWTRAAGQLLAVFAETATPAPSAATAAPARKTPAAQ